MIKSSSFSVRRPAVLMVFLCMCLLSLALTACGGDSAASSTSSTTASSGSSSGAMAVNIKESKGADGKDAYACDPTSITVKKGDSVSFTNKTDEIQDFDKGDAQKAGMDLKLNLNQAGNVTFNNTGTFTIKSEKGAEINVTVQ